VLVSEYNNGGGAGDVVGGGDSGVCGGPGDSDSRCGVIGGGRGDRGRRFGRVVVCWATLYHIPLAPYKQITIYSTYLIVVKHDFAREK